MNRAIILLAVVLAGCSGPAEGPEAAASESTPLAAPPAATLPAGTSSMKLEDTDVCTGTAPVYCIGYSPVWGELPVDGTGAAVEIEWNVTAAGMEEIAVFLVLPGGNHVGKEPGAAGASPLRLPLGDVAEDTYHVRFYPAKEVRGPAEQTIAWRVLSS